MNANKVHWMKIILLFFICIFFGFVAKAQSWQSFTDSAVAAQEKRQFNDAVFYFKKAQQSLPSDSSETFTAIDLTKNWRKLPKTQQF